MKIGIITWFKYENYGTKLQAIALQRYLRNSGFQVELLNFSVDDSRYKINIVEKISFFEKIYKNIGYKILCYTKKKHGQEIKKKSEKFEEIINNLCILTEEIATEDDYIRICNEFDALVFGSDQIWNPYWYNKFYYADYSKITTKRVAYAPSFGVNKIPDIVKSEIRNSLLRFDKLSVRERTGSELIHQLTGIMPTLVLDPTLLLKGEEWDKVLSLSEETIPNDSVLCYFLTDNWNHWHATKKMAKCMGLNVQIVPQQGFSYLQSKKVNHSISVEEFVDSIKNASVVVTDSFHAVVFSIIYRKPFIVFERHSPVGEAAQNSRIYNLLSEFGLEHTLVKYGSKSIQNPQIIDYDKVIPKLNSMIKRSEQYILDALEDLR